MPFTSVVCEVVTDDDVTLEKHTAVTSFDPLATFKIYVSKGSIKHHVKCIQAGGTVSCTHEKPHWV